MSYIEKNLSDIVKDNTAEYAVSVAIDRAIPNLIDGLKPVHRRVLQTMYEMGLHSGSKPVKTANVIGTTIAKYHPHGSADFTTLVQPFTCRYPLIEGIGNWGSPDIPDSVAAERYTECRLTRFAETVYLKDTEYFLRTPNYDSSREEFKFICPTVPGCLLLGGLGLAVGVSTNYPSHKLSTIVESLIAYIKKPDSEEYMDILKPDLPQKALIASDKEAVKSLYKTGRATILFKPYTTLEQDGDKWSLHIKSFPPGFSKKTLGSPKILELIETGKVSFFNNSSKDIHYIYTSKSKECLDIIKDTLSVRASYSMTLELNGKIHTFTLKEIYDAFLEAREAYNNRKYTDLLNKVQADKDYSEIIVQFKQSGLVNRVVNMSYKDGINIIRTTLKVSNEVAVRILDTPIKSLMADDVRNLIAKIKKLKDMILFYQKKLKYPGDTILEELESSYKSYISIHDINRCEYENSRRVALMDRSNLSREEVKGLKKSIKVSEAQDKLRESVNMEIQSKRDLEKAAILLGSKEYFLFYRDGQFLITKGYHPEWFPILASVVYGVDSVEDIIIISSKDKTIPADMFVYKRAPRGGSKAIICSEENITGIYVQDLSLF